MGFYRMRDEIHYLRFRRAVSFLDEVVRKVIGPLPPETPWDAALREWGMRQHRAWGRLRRRRGGGKGGPLTMDDVEGSSGHIDEVLARDFRMVGLPMACKVCGEAVLMQDELQAHWKRTGHRSYRSVMVDGGGHVFGGSR